MAGSDYIYKNITKPNKMGAVTSSESSTAKTALSDLSKLDIKAFVKIINITGISRTKNDYVQNTTDRLLKVGNFQNLEEELLSIRNDLQELRVFKNIKISLDTNKSESATQYDYDVTFECEELSRITGKVGTQIGQQEGSIRAELNFPNICGRGESLSLNGSFGNKRSYEFFAKISKPFLHHRKYGSLKPDLSVSIFKRVEPRPESNYNLFVNGILGEFSWRKKHLNHSLQYEISMREMKALNKKSIPIEIREQFGPQLSSLIRYVAKFDKRDDHIFPRRGIFIKTTNEANVLSSDMNYWRTINHIEYNYSILSDIVLQMVFRAGIIQADQNPNDKSVPLSSLFTTGGPLSIRGFQYGGINKHIDNCLIGSTAFWSGGLHLWAPLPFSNFFNNFGNLFRTHLFWNCGNTSLRIENMRSSIGIGIALKLGDLARVEFNYCYPLLKQSNDQFVKAFQFGIGYEFL